MSAVRPDEHFRIRHDGMAALTWSEWLDAAHTRRLARELYVQLTPDGYAAWPIGRGAYSRTIYPAHCLHSPRCPPRCDGHFCAEPGAIGGYVRVDPAAGTLTTDDATLRRLGPGEYLWATRMAQRLAALRRPRGSLRVVSPRRASYRNPARARTPAAFGRVLKRYAASNDSYRDTGLGSTWFAGGCWVMAAALARWIGPSARLYAVVGAAGPHHPAIPQHVAVHVGDRFFDANGASTLKQLWNYWQNDEGINVLAVEPFTPALQRQAHEAQMTCPAVTTSALDAALVRRFGRASDWRF